MKCIICDGTLNYTNCLVDGDGDVWCEACWNAAHPDEQYNLDIRHGDGRRGSRST